VQDQRQLAITEKETTMRPGFDQPEPERPDEVDTGRTSAADLRPDAEPADVLEQAEEVPDPDEETAVDTGDGR
jgi:hypothetical protein